MGAPAAMPLEFGFDGSASGEVVERYPLPEGLPPLTQSAPLPLAVPADTVSWLETTILAFTLDGPATDIAKAGHSWLPTAVDPTLWTEPSDPTSAVEPLLPPSYAGQDPTEAVGFVETFAADDADQEPGSALALARRSRHAQAGTREFVRGRLGSVPFMPGGEQWRTAAAPGAAAAAEAAASGAWLAELESGALPRIAAPGLDCGAFGAWASSDGGAGEVAEDLGDLRLSPVAGPPPPPGAFEQDGPGQGKVALADLFSGVWMAEEEEEEEVEEEVGEEGDVAAAPAPATAEAPAPAGARPASALDALLALPDALDLPGGAEPELAGVLAAHAQSDAWAGRAPGAAPRRARKTAQEWAVSGAVPDLARQWETLRPGLARTYPFELDTFQKEAIVHMEAGRSVFVAAHTSAGKTVAAEYAFALAAKHCTRAIYTSPIKTISNQKFRDFAGEFDVGLLTGDVSIRPEAACLIMTTEILRSMLYKGADIVRDIEWVIFDEVHYVNDAERGVVWEEVIIMLPSHVNLLLLSATVPNVMEFAGWVGRTKRKVVHVTGTTRRPVPLEHSLYHGGELYTVCSAEGYDPRGFRAAKDAEKRRTGAPATKAEAQRALPTGRGAGGGGARGGRGAAPRPNARPGGGGAPGGGGGGGVQLRSEKSQWVALIERLRKRELLPVVVFCFSKRRCDALADNLQALDLTTAQEKSEIHVFCEKALARLRGGDRSLPQVLRVREMLKRGLGVHHAGLLPIVKEVVEMLFCRGVIKVLYSTETFAMGVNAPARTVVFQSLRKHDGRSFRSLLPGEYTQMAGRAGRRGLDTVGTVILAAWEELPDEGDVRRLLTGSATKLESQFRLTYSMILNLLRVEDLRVEDMLKRSFAEFHAQRAAPEAAAALARGQAALARLRARPWPASPLATTREEVEAYAEVGAGVEALDARVAAAVAATRGAQAALSNGRVVLLSSRATGVTEVGVVIDPGEGAGGGKKGARAGTGGGGGGWEAGSGGGGEGGGRRYLVLALHRPSPLDAAAIDAELAQQHHPADAAAGQQQQQQPMKLLGRRDDDDDASFLGGGGGGRRGGLAARGRGPPLPRSGEVGGAGWRLAEVPAADISGICRVKVRVEAEEIAGGDAAATAAAVHALLSVREAAPGGDPPVMDPVADLKLNAIELVGDVRERSRLAALRASLPAHRDPLLPEMLAAVRSERLLAGRLRALAAASGDAGLAQLPEFHVRVAVLQRMGYLDAGRAVTMKGRVACEINSGDELVATELIFGGVLAELTPEEAVALLSALVFQERSDAAPELPPRLAAARDAAAAAAYAAGEAQRECGLDVVPEDFVLSTLRFGLMEVVYEWARGTPFSQICALTDVMEGSIVRAIVRLDETCREMRDAARVMGNTALYQQMEAASAAIKRDIVFAASLYVA